ncbi:MAG: putative 2-aminoethylphosphonate ABC transporter substrate-binding protein [Enterobacteriaceae bacterium]|jgi:iron(III) transport system substrate-binding protein|nr:putative 2-aminoethylphosphonate ABC transporter substrate-binding protein [Enterobacteriaceae bacterium]
MKNNPLKITGIALFTSLIMSTNLYAAPTELTVYTALEVEQLGALKSEFEKQNPDIEIKWIRDSTGVITAKLLAEKNNPKADVIWGVAATSLLVLDQQNMLAGYAPKGLEKLDAKFIDPQNPPHWIGMDASLGTVCYNTIEGKKENIPAPKSWQDLASPIYKDKIIMPNPASSGTGFLNVAGWLQSMGEKQGWEYMDKLHNNIERYTHSGSAPCKLVASGEAVVGISFDFPTVKLQQNGAPIDVIFPEDGSGWDMEAAAIVNNTPHQAAAEKLMDFAVTETANKLYNQSFAVLAIPSVAKIPDAYPKDLTRQMNKNDFNWMAQHRERILTDWTKRYNEKSEAKK